MPATVGLIVGMSAGSGVIVNEDGLILTAAHVIGKPGTSLKVVLPDGTFVNGKSLGVNEKIDSGMVRITDKPPKDAKWPGAAEGRWPFAILGDSKGLKVGQWVIALGHPGGPKRDRPPPLRLGRFEAHNSEETALRTDCTLVGGDSGGPLYDLNGKVIGIHSRIGLFLENNMHVPAEAFKNEWEKLSKGEVVGKSSPNRVTFGWTLEEGEDTITVKSVDEGGPADKAGIKIGDTVLKINKEKVSTRDEIRVILTAFAPRDEIVVDVERGEKKLSLKVTLGSRGGPRPKSKQ
ncbi:Serine protease, DegP/HtrA, do-like [Fimbriiglobus ruber]|uniref:Serine protease, DegP/HtrA, do-like n=2 Tax=Fimbriiglobus ruber TaxID=1908690 RepID=A0A225E4F7_9BACT|nr:Serine protease, DegP/HtrA, do-like [Fimbriiglobus ruber]